MAYEPTNWKSGDVVTSAKLNKLENGVADASEGGAGLPDVTSADNGKVLGVVNGEWGKADAPDNTLTYTITLTGEGTGTTSVPIADIYEAFVQNKVVVQRAEIREGSSVVYVSFVITQMMYDEGEGGRYEIWAVTGSGGDAVALFSAESTGTNSLRFQINEIGSSLAPMIVTGTISGTDVTITTQLSDIYDAQQDGRAVFLELDMNGINLRFNLSGCEYTSGTYNVGFFTAIPETNGIDMIVINFNDSTTGELILKTIS